MNQKKKSSLTASMGSDCSLDKLSADLSSEETVLEMEFMNGSLVFRMKGFPVPKLEGLGFAEYFHEPIPPFSFHSP